MLLGALVMAGMSDRIPLQQRLAWLCVMLLIALACAVGFEGIWAVKQRFITRLDRVAGTLDHANSLSMYLCMTVPPLVAGADAGTGSANCCPICPAKS